VSGNLPGPLTVNKIGSVTVTGSPTGAGQAPVTTSMSVATWQTVGGGGGGSGTGPGGQLQADDIYYDPSTSGVDGDVWTPPIPAHSQREVNDILNREITDRAQMLDVELFKDVLRALEAQKGAASLTVPGEGVVQGIAPLDSNRIVPFNNLGSGTATGSKFLRDDRTWAAPTAAAARTWVKEPGDHNLKALNSIPEAFSNTATLLAASTCYAMRIWLPAGTFTNFLVEVQTAGASLAANLYAFCLVNCDATGTLVTGSGTADAASVWTTTGTRSIALGTPFVNATAAFFYALAQTGTATTQPKVGTPAAHAISNFGLASGTNVAPNAANAPLYGTATTGFSGLTPPSACGNIIEGGSTIPFLIGLN
jgi:hypothetical protein